jgi:hypothetical protein
MVLGGVSVGVLVRSLRSLSVVGFWLLDWGEEDRAPTTNNLRD